jgi:hypothetical protein
VSSSTLTCCAGKALEKKQKNKKKNMPQVKTVTKEIS